MTTYELPPEPEVGTRVRTATGVEWTRTNDGWTCDTKASGISWGALLTHWRAPLTLIEPDPWPTEPLIVASIGERREVLARNEGGGYESPITGAWKGGPTLTNVVPVTVVPAAALPVLWSALEQWLNNGVATFTGVDTRMNRLVGAVESLRRQIDALGVDL